MVAFVVVAFSVVMFPTEAKSELKMAESAERICAVRLVTVVEARVELPDAVRLMVLVVELLVVEA